MVQNKSKTRLKPRKRGEVGTLHPLCDALSSFGVLPNSSAKTVAAMRLQEKKKKTPGT